MSTNHNMIFGGPFALFGGRLLVFVWRVLGGVVLFCLVLLMVSCQSSPSPGVGLPVPVVPVVEMPATLATEPPASTRPRREFNELFRPQFHFSARSGWIADPNGMVRWRGLHHLFWWGHAVSEDLVFWRDQIPWAMHGDDGSFDYFSGSVVVDRDNSSGLGIGDVAPMVALYTMHYLDDRPEQQGLSVSHDYTNFFYYHGNPVLGAPQKFFRDPQVYYDDVRGRWLMVVALPETRTVSLYASQNLRDWSYLSNFGRVGARGGWWEVPDLFEIAVDGSPDVKRWVLMCGVGPNSVQYFIGDFDGDRFVPDRADNAMLYDGTGLPGLVYADFENGLPDGWTISGSAISLAAGRADSFVPGLGRGRLITRGVGAGGRGTATIESSTFIIQEPAINFLMAGGADVAQTSVSLIIDGEVVRTASGDGSELLRWVGWDVSEWAGAQAFIRVADRDHDNPAAYVAVDHILFAPAPALTGREHANWLDHGMDYYAVRTYRDYDGTGGRPVTMGWMGNWQYANLTPTSWGRGALALPRELSLRAGAGGLRLVQRPIAALAKLRGPRLVHTTTDVPMRSSLDALMDFAPARNTYELDISFIPDNPRAQLGFELAQNSSGGRAILVRYSAATATLTLERGQPETGEFSEHFARVTSAVLPARDGRIRLRVFVDQSSVEVFANDGDVSMTSVMFPAANSTGLSLFSRDTENSELTISAWELDSIW
ncbi:MAG: glycoside hydrolase family 32 protein [Proteobacteria bacterium]|nr:glycoside hydrolase family 32 protein [Pseudomonadota bacterium]